MAKEKAAQKRPLSKTLTGIEEAGLQKRILILSLLCSGLLVACGKFELKPHQASSAPVTDPTSAAKEPTAPVPAENSAQANPQATNLAQNLKDYFDKLPPLPGGKDTGINIDEGANLNHPLTPVPAPRPQQPGQQIVPLIGPATPKPTQTPAPAPVVRPPAQPVPAQQEAELSEPADDLIPTNAYEKIIPTAEELKAADLSVNAVVKNLFCKKIGLKGCITDVGNSVEQAVKNSYSIRLSKGAKVALKITGQLVNDAELPPKGLGFHQKADSRSARFATDQAVQFAEFLGAEATKMGLTDNLVIGDLSVKGGGVCPGHVSHQNGLDIDIGLLPASGSQANAQQFPKDLVLHDTPTAKFGIRQNLQLLKTAVDKKWVYFILASKGVKKALCEEVAHSNNQSEFSETLSRIEPWPEHENHFHFRLMCPISSPRCIPMPPRQTTDTGCESLK